MTQEEILTKAIEKAKNNGWEDVEGIKTIQIENSVFLIKSYAPNHIFFDIKELLFDHDFAKAFWGEEKVIVFGHDSNECSNMISCCSSPQYLKSWQYHLQEMVLKEDPIAYLGRFI